MIEVGNALSAVNRTASVQFINQCYQTDNIKVISVDTMLLMRALELYNSRQDKDWSLTDCISFIVMKGSQGINSLSKSSSRFKPTIGNDAILHLFSSGKKLIKSCTSLHPGYPDSDNHNK